MGTYDYKTADGEQVPGVTTVIRQLAKPALVHAAWKLGIEGKDYREVWGNKRDAGTLAHGLAEHHVKGKALPEDFWAGVPDDVKEAAQALYGSFRSGLEQVQFVPLASEIPIISETHRYGGCIDAVGTVLGEPALLDLKSRTLYKDQIIQVAAYKRLWDEDPAHKDIQIKSVHVLGMTEGFHHHHISARNLPMGIGAFDALLELQVYVKGIKV